MGLSFLVPAFLLGLAALAIPIWVHLRNRPKQDTVEFPSLMFLEQIPYRAVQRQQLRHRALFALRCLALGLLALAFARPFLGSLDPSGGGTRGAREVVVAIDRSWSMEYGDRWDRAIGEARGLIGGLSGADRVSLVLFDDRAEVRLRSADAAAAATALDGVTPSQATTDLTAGLRAAREILAASTLPVREVVLISDFQRTGWDVEVDIEMPEGTVVRPVGVAAEGAQNVAVAAVAVDRVADPDGGGDLLAVTARLARVGEGEAEVGVSLEIPGAETQTRSATMAGNAAAVVAFDPVPAGDAAVTGVVSIDGDALVGDDRFYFQASPGQALSVLLLDHPRASPGDSLYLRRALAIGSQPLFRVERTALGDLDRAALAARDLVILNDPGELDPGSAATLSAWVEDGGGLLVALGELTDGLGGLGGQEGLIPFETAVVDRAADLGGTLAYFDTDHPAFELFSAPGSGDLAAARFYRYHAIADPPEDGVIARFDDGAVALLERRVGAGRVIVWTSTFDTFWNDLPLQPVYLPVVQRLARHAADFREPRNWLDAQRPLAAVELAASVGALGAEDAALRVDGEPFPPDGGLRLDAGFHRLEWSGGPGDGGATVAVNLDRAESDLSTVDPEEVAAAVVWRQGGEVEGEEVVVPETDIERSQSIWWYLVILAFVLLGAETALSNRLSPRASSKEPPVQSPRATE